MSWLRKADNYNHINVRVGRSAEGSGFGLEMVVEGCAPARPGWVDSVITDEKRMQTEGAEEMLVESHLGVLGKLEAERGLRAFREKQCRRSSQGEKGLVRGPGRIEARASCCVSVYLFQTKETACQAS